MGFEQDEEWLPKVVEWSPCHWLLSDSNDSTIRFFIDRKIALFADAIVRKFGSPMELAMLFPTHTVAARCVDFFHKQSPALGKRQDVRVVELVPDAARAGGEGDGKAYFGLAAVLFPKIHFKIAKSFWQHTGDGISSRRAEFCHKAFEDGLLVRRDNLAQAQSALQRLGKGPRRYQRGSSIDNSQSSQPAHANGALALSSGPTPERPDYVQFVEERFGRNLDLSLTAKAKLAIRRRIAGSLTADVDLHEALDMDGDMDRRRNVPGFSENDVYLYPTGMSSIFNTHRIMMAVRSSLKSICFG